MATTDDSIDGLREWCESCKAETLHRVSVQMRAGSADSETAAFSREPYRITECRHCGDRSAERMTHR